MSHFPSAFPTAASSGTEMKMPTWEHLRPLCRWKNASPPPQSEEVSIIPPPGSMAPKASDPEDGPPVQLRHLCEVLHGSDEADVDDVWAAEEESIARPLTAAQLLEEVQAAIAARDPTNPTASPSVPPMVGFEAPPGGIDDDSLMWLEDDARDARGSAALRRCVEAFCLTVVIAQNVDRTALPSSQIASASPPPEGLALWPGSPTMKSSPTTKRPREPTAAESSGEPVQVASDTVEAKSLMRRRCKVLLDTALPSILMSQRLCPADVQVLLEPALRLLASRHAAASAVIFGNDLSPSEGIPAPRKGDPVIKLVHGMEDTGVLPLPKDIAQTSAKTAVNASAVSSGNSPICSAVDPPQGSSDFSFPTGLLDQSASAPVTGVVTSAADITAKALRAVNRTRSPTGRYPPPPLTLTNSAADVLSMSVIEAPSDDTFPSNRKGTSPMEGRSPLQPPGSQGGFPAAPTASNAPSRSTVAAGIVSGGSVRDAVRGIVAANQPVRRQAPAAPAPAVGGNGHVRGGEMPQYMMTRRRTAPLIEQQRKTVQQGARLNAAPVHTASGGAPRVQQHNRPLTTQRRSNMPAPSIGGPSVAPQRAPINSAPRPTVPAAVVLVPATPSPTKRRRGEMHEDLPLPQKCPEGLLPPSSASLAGGIPATSSSGADTHRHHHADAHIMATPPRPTCLGYIPPSPLAIPGGTPNSGAFAGAMVPPSPEQP